MTLDPTSWPASIDGLHILLAVIALLCLLLPYFRKRSRIPPSATGEAQRTHAPAPPQSLKQTTPESALQLLALLQQEARFIDFIQEDLAGFTDADIGAAARVVHGGGQRVLASYFSLIPVRQEQEQSRIRISAGFNPTEVRLTGNVVGDPPFNGTLMHRGWRAAEVKLPQLAPGHDVHILAPAEVEL
ncbi:MAG: DUF2760 domain-containing protein [Gammaproteobacteria bacterium]|nr:DUF2760 domain-containing protein [Gammaproteobacteria bacterium]